MPSLKFALPVLLLIFLVLAPATGAAQRARVEGQYIATEKVVSSTEPYSQYKPAGKVSKHLVTVTPGCPKGPCRKYTAKLKWLVVDPWKGETSLETAKLLFKETAQGVYEASARSPFFGLVGINCPGDEAGGFRKEDIAKLVFKVVRSKQGVATKLVGTGEWKVDRGRCGVGHAREKFTVVAK